MTRKHSRPQKTLPSHPNRVIATTMRRGFSAAIELQRDIKNKYTISLYASSQEILSVLDTNQD